MPCRRGSCSHCLLFYFREVLQEYNVYPAGEEAVLIVCFFISEKFYRSIMYALQERKLELQELQKDDLSSMQFLGRVIKESVTAVINRNIMGA